MSFKPMVIRGFNNYDVRAASDEAASLPGDEPSMAQQHFREEADINTIVERFGLLGQLPQGVRAPMYGDFTGLGDFRDALDAVYAAEDSFMQMPPKVRSRFENNPALFVDFCSDPANLEEMKSLGLVVEKPQAPLASAVGTQPKAGGQPTAAEAPKAG